MEITFKGQLAEWQALFGASKDDPEAARVLQEIAARITKSAEHVDQAQQQIDTIGQLTTEPTGA